MEKTILIADDEPGFQALFRHILEPKGFTVSIVDNGEKALAAAKASDYALVILDVHMPKMTGLDVLAWLNEMKAALPVLILSSSAEADHINQKTKKLGAVACLQKPFEIDDLLKVVENVVRKKPA